MADHKLNLIEVLKLLEIVSLYDDHEKRKILTAATVQDILGKLRATETKIATAISQIQSGTIVATALGTSLSQLNTISTQIKKDIDKVSNFYNTTFSSKVPGMFGSC